MSRPRGNSRRARSAGSVTVLILLVGLGLLAGAVPAQGSSPAADALSLVAAELPVMHKGRKTSGGKVAAQLAPSVRVAVNAWAELAAEHGLSIVFPRKAEAVVLGLGDIEGLVRAAEVMDDTWELLEPLHSSRDLKPAATVAFLFDAASFRSEAWVAVLDALVKRRVLLRADARRMGREPMGMQLHAEPIFLQPSWDIAGDASAGDDEFRVDNEVAHKLTDCIVRTRFGIQPGCLRWGLGFVTEQRLFGSIYQFNQTGFVDAETHFAWPRRAEQAFTSLAKKKGTSLSTLLLDDSSPGTMSKPQLVAFGTLDYLMQRDVKTLNALLDELAELHSVAAKGKSSTTFLGDVEAAKEVLDRRLEGLNLRKLARHAKRIK